MALLPEEFSVVLVVFLSLGAWRMSKRHVLTRTPAAIETLGSATVLCVDKTGTLTQNKMILSTIYANNETYNIETNHTNPLPETYHDLFEYGYLASQKDPFDPIEKEIKDATETYLSNTEHVHETWQLVREYPLSKNLLALSNVWESYDKRRFVVAAKGSPEAIIDLCHLDHQQKETSSATSKTSHATACASSASPKQASKTQTSRTSNTTSPSNSSDSSASSTLYDPLLLTPSKNATPQASASS